MKGTMYDLMHSGAKISLTRYNGYGNNSHYLIPGGTMQHSNMIRKLSKEEWEKVCCILQASPLFDPKLRFACASS
jgi:hypothetical protein